MIVVVLAVLIAIFVGVSVLQARKADANQSKRTDADKSDELTSR
jgi:hypothetical protein